MAHEPKTCLKGRGGSSLAFTFHPVSLGACFPVKPQFPHLYPVRVVPFRGLGDLMWRCRKDLGRVWDVGLQSLKMGSWPTYFSCTPSPHCMIPS